MALPEPSPVRVVESIDPHRFAQEIRTAGQPVLLRGLAAQWPSVAAARQSDEALVDYLARFPAPRRATAIVGEAEIEGRFFYNEDVSALNFQRGVTPLAPFLDRLLRDRQEQRPKAMAVQSEIIPELLPGFEVENSLELVGPQVQPRAWIGNRITVAPHYDLMENIGVVVAGRRRFTLFPPDQVANLYPGPLELTPAGTPVSMVDPRVPDLDRFPGFAQAMEHAQVAVLEPGDAIYIPFHWWHGVESLTAFNLFVNYWWNDAPPGLGAPYDALMHALYALKHLPPEQRAVWRIMFDHYIFRANGDPAAHLPPHARGVLGEATPELLARMRATLKQILERM